VEAISDTLRGLSPSLVRQVLPLVEQLTPIYMDVAQGRQEFSPAPEETSKLIRNYYAVSKNLLLRFKDDTIDETIELASLLQGSSAISSSLDVTLRTLPGEGDGSGIGGRGCGCVCGYGCGCGWGGGMQ
jgi:hypothetical protein